MLSGTDEPPQSIDDLLVGPEDNNAPTPPAPPHIEPDPIPGALHADVPVKDQPDVEYVEAVSEGVALVRREDMTAWDLGDLLLRVCGPPTGSGPKTRARGFHSLKRYSADIGLAYELAVERRLVADAFPPGQRNTNASWSVHRELARADVPEEERHDLIRRDRWTLRSMQAHLASLNEPAPSSNEPANSTPSEASTPTSTSASTASPAPSPVSSSPPATDPPETAQESPKEPAPPSVPAPISAEGIAEAVADDPALAARIAAAVLGDPEVAARVLNNPDTAAALDAGARVVHERNTLERHVRWAKVSPGTDPDAPRADLAGTQLASIIARFNSAAAAKLEEIQDSNYNVSEAVKRTVIHELSRLYATAQFLESWARGDGDFDAQAADLLGGE